MGSMGHQRRQGLLKTFVPNHRDNGGGQALPMLKYAWDRGVTTIDTANVYSNGDSERIIGKFIKHVCELFQI